jgi:NAD(P)-dependent dehydrogenase (short-subunit alcohol dehydrogenase family)
VERVERHGGLAGASVVLTGATDGIGRATARLLAPLAGALVVHGPEPPDGARDLLDELRAAMRRGAGLVYLQADYAELAQVRGLADAVTAEAGPPDVLINNAGVAGPPERCVTADGIELTLQVNHLAPFLLTALLLPAMRERRARVVNVSSATHLSATLQLDDLGLAHHDYSPVRAYAQSKLAVVTATCALAADLGDGPCEAVSIHPGVVTTRLLGELFGMRGDDPSHAAGTIVRLAGSPDRVNGLYYDEERPAEPNPLARDPAVQRALVRASRALTGLPAA